MNLQLNLLILPSSLIAQKSNPSTALSFILFYFQSTESIIEFLIMLCDSKGPETELYLAEEAIGLAKALDWNVFIESFSWHG